MNLDAARSAKVLSRLVLTDLSRVTAPTLLLQGAQDTVVDPTGAVRLHQGLQAPKRLVMLEDSDHLVTLDRRRVRETKRETERSRPRIKLRVRALTASRGTEILCSLTELLQLQ